MKHYVYTFAATKLHFLKRGLQGCRSVFRPKTWIFSSGGLHLLFIAAIGVSFLIYTPVFCQAENNNFSRRGARALLFETLSVSEKEELIKLRKADKEKFRKVLKEKLESQEAALAKIKKENPGKFKALIESSRNKMKTRLRELRIKNPDKFAQFQKKHRKKLKMRIKQLREKDPARYQSLCSSFWEKKAMRQGFKQGIFKDENLNPQP
ncbi:MAG: hypothetical protein PHQ96_03975 [Candidatus Omnitrophica bacterium]|nr:hypothetical protein [Candidatus Omnitrophota bacterium]